LPAEARALSATASGGREREHEKGENKEQRTCAIANKFSATIFSSGYFKSLLNGDISADEFKKWFMDDEWMKL